MRLVPYCICVSCGRNSRSGHRENGQPICHKCYLKTYETPIAKCSKCGEYKNIFSRNPTILCSECYMEDYVAPKKICIGCGENKKVHKNTDAGPLCYGCYRKQYKVPKKVCSDCGETRVLSTKTLCCSCRNKQRLENDMEFATRCRLRKRVSKNVRAGKIRKSMTSLIDYGKIIEHLGYPPGPNHHIDHIFPLSAFNLMIEEHVIAAFAPENHQWLLGKENLRKKDKYDEKEFLEYLNRF